MATRIERFSEGNLTSSLKVDAADTSSCLICLNAHQGATADFNFETKCPGSGKAYLIHPTNSSHVHSPLPGLDT